MKLILAAIVLLSACTVAVNSTNAIQQGLRSGRSLKIKSGQTVALKYSYNNEWLGCASSWCSKAKCPERFFSKANSQCYGEVFQIYSKKARKRAIRVGNKVGLYYPKEKKWFGCFHAQCGKYPCPGNPSKSKGFQNAQKWKQCKGEVFEIFAYGKKKGQFITHKDAIMLRYVAGGNKWVSAWSKTVDTKNCPGSPTPNIHKYDQCSGEVFEIYKI